MKVMRVYVPFKHEFGGYQNMVFSIKRASPNKIHPVPVIDIINNGHVISTGVYRKSYEGIRDYILEITNEETRRVIEFEEEMLIRVWDRHTCKHRLIYESDIKNFQAEQRNY